MAAGPDNPLTPEDALSAPQAGAQVVRGSAWRLVANGLGIALGLITAALLLHHLGVRESGRYVTVISLIAVAVAMADTGLNVASSRELALRAPENRRRLMANIVGQRLVVMPLAVLAVVVFAVLADYPTRMVTGTILAGVGATLAALANAMLVRLTVELRNFGLAVVDFARQLVTLIGVAALVVAGARLTPFFAVMILAGLAMLALVPVVAGRKALTVPRLDRVDQRTLLATALPLAIALGLGQIYFRLVIVLMSLISSPRQTGYFGGSLRAMESLITIPILIVGVALPVLTAAARDDHRRLRYAIGGLSEGAVIGGALLILVTARAAVPVMAIIGGTSFRPAGAVLRIQVGALLFIMLYQIWTGALLALGHQRELILTNVLALLGLAGFAAVLVPAFGAKGGATASVLGDALLAGLIYWRLHRRLGRVMVNSRFLARVALAAGLACVPLLIGALPGFAAAALSGLIFLGVGQAIGMVPREVRDAFAGYGWRRPART
jgi:O-antigen/teichoic acid export membrane protein